MTTEIDLLAATLVDAEYEGVAFPTIEAPVEGGHDGVEHTAYGRRGSDCESTGRRAERGALKIPFVAPLRGYGSDLYPARFVEFLEKIRTVPIGRLTHPLLGDFTAWVREWKIDLDADVRNGVVVEVQWVEHNGDASVLSLEAGALPTDSPAAAQDEAATADAAMAATGTPTVTSSPATGYTPVATTVAAQLAFLESAPRGYAEIAASVDAMLLPVAVNLSLAAFSGATAHAAVASLERLRALVYALRARYLARFERVGTYTTPKGMSLWEVSLAVFGDATRAGEIAAVNPIPDWLFIPAGRVLQILPPA